jgi:multiple sugar transport system ATP-binding protein
MAEVRYEQATRVYPGTDSPAVDALDLEIGDGEFVVLVGPSGSGKTTALRMLAGLEEVDAGAIFIGERDVTDVTPKDRDVAMVFQNYALYPYLTVAANIAFPLRIARVPKSERDRRVHEVATMLGLVDYLERKPGQLSGGQRQRVAIARAILMNPRVLILDDATSNVDARVEAAIRKGLREAMRGRTTIIVARRPQTAALADRVAFMDAGRIVEVGVHEQMWRSNTAYRETLLTGVDVDQLSDEPVEERVS